MLVERVRRLAADDAAIAFDELESDDAGDALLDLVDERVKGFAEWREPQAVVHDVRVVQAHRAREAIEIPRRHKLLELFVGRMKGDGRWGFVHFAGLDADEPIFNHIDAADSVRARDRAEGADQLDER